MAYQKLQALRAISVIPKDDIIVPSPGDKVASGTTTSTVADKLADSSASFLGKVKLGATVYNTTDTTAAKVVGVSETELTLDANIMASGEAYVVYNTTNSEGPTLYVGTGGSLVIKTVGGDLVTLANVADASYIPIMVSTVQTATTASDIIALW